jgi:phosphoglucosamine mutase
MTERKYFGTDGIRGRVGDWPITADFMLKLGRAAGVVLARHGGNGSVVIGKDTRRSGYMFESALESGLIAAGANVQLLGPMPTPAVAQLTVALGASAGIVISASHNPHYDNGIKFFSARGEKLSDAQEAEIEAEIEAAFATVAPERLGKAVRMEDAADRYLEFCIGTAPPGFRLDGLRVALDCANGATYRVAPRLFAELGADVLALGDQPDGLNINRACGSTQPDTLKAAVKAGLADIGIAFDGDGDRVVFVDHEGKLVDGDDLIYLLACDWRSSGRLRGPVVGTLMTNYAIELALGKAGIEFRRAKVGDRYVHQTLVESGGVLGGEASGHVLCLDRSGTGDALVTALQVLDLLQRSGRPLATLCAGLARFPQKTINVRIANGARPIDSPAVASTRAAIETELEGRGRVVLRPSGTEPVVRVTVEADDGELVERLAQKLADAVKAAA